MRLCNKCGKYKSEDDFAFRSKAKSTRQHTCKVCHRLLMKDHYKANKSYYAEKARRNEEGNREAVRAYLIEYLSNHPCVDCGNTDIEVLQFDHLDRKTKKYNVSSMLVGYGLKTIQEEIDKCAVRCANCHIRRTRRQLGWWTYSE